MQRSILGGAGHQPGPLAPVVHNNTDMTPAFQTLSSKLIHSGWIRFCVMLRQKALVGFQDQSMLATSFSSYRRQLSSFFERYRKVCEEVVAGRRRMAGVIQKQILEEARCCLA